MGVFDVSVKINGHVRNSPTNTYFNDARHCKVRHEGEGLVQVVKGEEGTAFF